MSIKKAIQVILAYTSLRNLKGVIIGNFEPAADYTDDDNALEYLSEISYKDPLSETYLKKLNREYSTKENKNIAYRIFHHEGVPVLGTSDALNGATEYGVDDNLVDYTSKELDGTIGAWENSFKTLDTYSSEIEAGQKTFNFILANAGIMLGLDLTQQGSIAVPYYSSKAEDVQIFKSSKDIKRKLYSYDYSDIVDTKVGVVGAFVASKHAGLNAFAISLGIPLIESAAPFIGMATAGATFAKMTKDLDLIKFEYSLLESHDYSIAESYKRDSKYVDGTDLEEFLYEKPFISLATIKVGDTLYPKIFSDSLPYFKDFRRGLEVRDFSDVCRYANDTLDVCSDSLSIPGFELWGGQRAQDDLKELNFQNPNAWSGKMSLKYEDYISQSCSGGENTACEELYVNKKIKVRQSRYFEYYNTLLTETPQEIHLVVDDLRPDLLKEFSVNFNFSFNFRWVQNSDNPSKYNLYYSANGSEELNVLVNSPIDQYGNWILRPGELASLVNVKTSDLIRDGQNTLSFSAKNKVGLKHGARLFVLKQPTPPLIEYLWPIDGVISSNINPVFTFSIDMLDYPGLSASDIEWSLFSVSDKDNFLDFGSITWDSLASINQHTLDSLNNYSLNYDGNNAENNLFSIDLSQYSNHSLSTDSLTNFMVRTKSYQESTKQVGKSFTLMSSLKADTIVPKLTIDSMKTIFSSNINSKLAEINWQDESNLRFFIYRILDESKQNILKFGYRHFPVQNDLIVDWNGKSFHCSSQSDSICVDGKYFVEIFAFDEAVWNREFLNKAIIMDSIYSEYENNENFEMSFLYEPRTILANENENWNISLKDTSFYLINAKPELTFKEVKFDSISVNSNLLDLTLNSSERLNYHIKISTSNLVDTIKAALQLNLISDSDSISSVFQTSFVNGVIDETFLIENDSKLLETGNYKISLKLIDELGNRQLFDNIDSVEVDRSTPRLENMYFGSSFYGVSSNGAEIDTAIVNFTTESENNCLVKWFNSLGDTVAEGSLSNTLNTNELINFNHEIYQDLNDTNYYGDWKVVVECYDPAKNYSSLIQFVSVGTKRPEITFPDSTSLLTFHKFAIRGVVNHPDLFKEPGEVSNENLKWKLEWSSDSINWKNEGIEILPSKHLSKDSLHIGYGEENSNTTLASLDMTSWLANNPIESHYYLKLSVYCDDGACLEAQTINKFIIISAQGDKNDIEFIPHQLPDSIWAGDSLILSGSLVGGGNNQYEYKWNMKDAQGIPLVNQSFISHAGNYFGTPNYDSLSASSKNSGLAIGYEDSVWSLIYKPVFNNADELPDLGVSLVVGDDIYLSGSKVPTINGDSILWENTTKAEKLEISIYTDSNSNVSCPQNLMGIECFELDSNISYPIFNYYSGEVEATYNKGIILTFDLLVAISNNVELGNIENAIVMANYTTDISTDNYIIPEHIADSETGELANSIVINSYLSEASGTELFDKVYAGSNFQKVNSQIDYWPIILNKSEKFIWDGFTNPGGYYPNTGYAKINLDIISSEGNVFSYYDSVKVVSKPAKIDSLYAPNKDLYLMQKIDQSNDTSTAIFDLSQINFKYQLKNSNAYVKALIKDADGSELYELQAPKLIQAHRSDFHTLSWDGKLDADKLADEGEYTLELQILDSDTNSNLIVVDSSKLIFNVIISAWKDASQIILSADSSTSSDSLASKIGGSLAIEFKEDTVVYFDDDSLTFVNTKGDYLIAASAQAKLFNQDSIKYKVSYEGTQEVIDNPALRYSAGIRLRRDKIKLNVYYIMIGHGWGTYSLSGPEHTSGNYGYVKVEKNEKVFTRGQISDTNTIYLNVNSTWDGNIVGFDGTATIPGGVFSGEESIPRNTATDFYIHVDYPGSSNELKSKLDVLDSGSGGEYDGEDIWIFDGLDDGNDNSLVTNLKNYLDNDSYGIKTYHLESEPQFAGSLIGLLNDAPLCNENFINIANGERLLKCEKTNSFNPNLNILEINITPHPSDGGGNPWTWGNDPEGVVGHGSADTKMGAVFHIKIPDEYFDASWGVQNLANTMVRLDGYNTDLKAGFEPIITAQDTISFPLDTSIANSLENFDGAGTVVSGDNKRWQLKFFGYNSTDEVAQSFDQKIIIRNNQGQVKDSLLKSDNYSVTVQYDVGYKLDFTVKQKDSYTPAITNIPFPASETSGDNYWNGEYEGKKICEDNINLEEPFVSCYKRDINQVKFVNSAVCDGNLPFAFYDEKNLEASLIERDFGIPSDQYIQYDLDHCLENNNVDISKLNISKAKIQVSSSEYHGGEIEVNNTSINPNEEVYWYDVNSTDKNNRNFVLARSGSDADLIDWDAKRDAKLNNRLAYIFPESVCTTDALTTKDVCRNIFVSGSNIFTDNHVIAPFDIHKTVDWKNAYTNGKSSFQYLYKPLTNIEGTVKNTDLKHLKLSNLEVLDIDGSTHPIYQAKWYNKVSGESLEEDVVEVNDDLEISISRKPQANIYNSNEWVTVLIDTLWPGAEVYYTSNDEVKRLVSNGVSLDEKLWQNAEVGAKYYKNKLWKVLGYINLNKLNGSTSFFLVKHNQDQNMSTSYYRKFDVMVGHALTNEENVVKSIAGDVEVTLRDSSYASDSVAVTIRTLDPQSSKITNKSGISVLGPIVEALPSYNFCEDEDEASECANKMATIEYHISKEEFDAYMDLNSSLSKDPLSYKIYKLKDSNVVVLTDLKYEFYTKNNLSYRTSNPKNLVDADNKVIEWEVMTIYGTTSSFSEFAILNSLQAKSFSFDFKIDPVYDSTITRNIHFYGDSIDRVILYLDDDSLYYSSLSDSTPYSLVLDYTGKMPLDTVISFNSQNYISYLHAIPMRGDTVVGVPLTRKLVVEPVLNFSYDGSDTLYMGSINGFMEIPYISSARADVELKLNDSLGNTLESENFYVDEKTLNSSLYLHAPVSWDSSIISYRSVFNYYNDFNLSKQILGPTILVDGDVPQIEMTANMDYDGSWNFIDWTANFSDISTEVIKLELIATLGGKIVVRDTIYNDEFMTDSVDVNNMVINKLSKTVILPRDEMYSCIGCELKFELKAYDKGHNYSVVNKKWNEVYPLPNELIAWYPMQEGFGNLALDVGPYKNNLELSSFDLWDESGFLKLSSIGDTGASNLWGFDDNIVNDTDSTWAIEGWYKSGYSADTSSLWNWGSKWRLYRIGQDLHLSHTNDHISFYNIFEEDNLWTHIAISYKDEQVKVWRNGVVFAAKPLYELYMIADTNSLNIGGDSTIVDATLRDWKFYNTSLNDEQVKGLYSNSSYIVSGLEIYQAEDIYQGGIDNQNNSYQRSDCQIASRKFLDIKDTASLLSLNVSKQGLYNIWVQFRSSDSLLFTMNNNYYVVYANAQSLTQWNRAKIKTLDNSDVKLQLNVGDVVNLELKTKTELDWIALVPSDVSIYDWEETPSDVDSLYTNLYFAELKDESSGDQYAKLKLRVRSNESSNVGNDFKLRYYYNEKELSHCVNIWSPSSGVNYTINGSPSDDINWIEFDVSGVSSNYGLNGDNGQGLYFALHDCNDWARFWNSEDDLSWISNASNFTKASQVEVLSLDDELLGGLVCPDTSISFPEETNSNENPELVQVVAKNGHWDFSKATNLLYNIENISNDPVVNPVLRYYFTINPDLDFKFVKNYVHNADYEIIDYNDSNKILEVSYNHTLNPGEKTDWGGYADFNLSHEPDWNAVWNYQNDWSHQTLTSDYKVNQYITVHDKSGKHLWGYAPEWDENQDAADEKVKFDEKQIIIDLDEAGVVEISYYNDIGKKIELLYRGYLGEGIHNIPLSVYNYANRLNYLTVVRVNDAIWWSKRIKE